MNDLDRQQRVHVADKAEELRVGVIDRRQFIRSAALAGFGIASAKYLCGCTRPPPQTTVADGASADSAGMTQQQKQFLKEVGGRFKGTKIRIVSENTAPGLIISKMAKEEFT